MSNPILERARQGDPSAIAQLINKSLANKGITAKANRQDDCLRLLLSGDSQIDDRSGLINYIQSGVRKLAIEGIANLQIYYQLKGEDMPSWNESVSLQSAVTPVANPNESGVKFTTPEYMPTGAGIGIFAGCAGMGCGLFLFVIPVIGWIVGAGVILASIIFAIQAASGKATGHLKGACPYCETENMVDETKPGFNCKGCKRRVLIKDKKFYQT